MYKMNKHTENIAKSNTGPPPAPINSNLQPLFRRTFYKPEHDKSSDIEQKPPFGDRKKSKYTA